MRLVALDSWTGNALREKATEAVRAYWRKMRNDRKADYCALFFRWIIAHEDENTLTRSGGPEDPDGPAPHLSYSAKQAVRLNVRAIIEAVHHAPTEADFLEQQRLEEGAAEAAGS